MKNFKIAVIGLGYVGLPLAVEFAKKYSTIGVDINLKRVDDLLKGNDTTLEVNSEQLKSVLNHSKGDKGFFPTSKIEEAKKCNIIIITVPTPIDSSNNPVLTPLIMASEAVSKIMKPDDIIIFESTVYPGATEEVCVPILEKYSGMKFNKDFFVGYSPERINPGDKERTVTKILKVTSGSTVNTSKTVDKLYKSIIKAGTHLAPSIKVAEAAKVIENSQRDINIAFINELAKIFSLLDLNTQDVLEAAGTKWNFLPFKPGLVGGHCIGVDPYYLARKAIEVGYNPEIILSGRRLNDSMSYFVASEVVKLMSKKEIKIKNSEALVLGLTFKENCPDVRNTKVIDLINSLSEFGINVTTYDPWADSDEINDIFNINFTSKLPDKKFDILVLAVSHNEFLTIDYDKLKKSNSVFYDVKGIPGIIADRVL